MELLQAIEKRHSVRKYTPKPIEGEVRAALQAEVDACNAEGGLHIQLVCDEPEAFGTGIFKYGQFKGVRNYLVLAGPDTPELDELVGYYGERVVLRAQQLGLNSCWVALTFNRRKTHYELAPGERMALVVALGYGQTQGVPRKSKAAVDMGVRPGMPGWFEVGVAAALLAPTAMNQQRFAFELLDEPASDGRAQVRLVVPRRGSQVNVDKGIVKYHFEVAAGTGNFAWV